MMYTYGFCLFFILIAQIGAGIAAFALKGDLRDNIDGNLRNGLVHYKDENIYRNAWDLVQNNFDCCGVADGGYCLLHGREDGDKWSICLKGALFLNLTCIIFFINNNLDIIFSIYMM